MNEKIMSWLPFIAIVVLLPAISGPLLVDENGNPIGTPPGESQGIPVPSQPGGPDQSELDRIFNSPAPPREPQRQPPPPRSEPAPDPLQPRPEQPQG